MTNRHLVLLMLRMFGTVWLWPRRKFRRLPPAFSKWLTLAAVHRLNQIVVGRTL